MFYDDSLLSITDSDVKHGSLWPQIDGWSLTKNTAIAGQIRVVLFNTTATATGPGEIAQLDFTVHGGATSGSTPLNIEPVDPNEGGLLWTESDGSILIAEPLLGDYDGSGTVDTADYALWRSTFGSTNQLAADGNNNGVIDAADYNIYRDNLGNTTEISLSIPISQTESMWQNPRNAMDVDDDGIVTLTDIFVVANDLYFNFARMLPVPTVTPNAPQPYIDTDGDGWVTFVDALLVAHEWRSIVGETEAAVAQMNSPVTGLEQNERSAVVLEALDVASAPGTSSPLETAEIAEPDGVQSNGLGPFWILQAVDAERGPSNRVSRTATGRLEQPESKASAESLVNVESIPNSWSTAVSREIDYAPLTVSSGLAEPTDANVGADYVFARLGRFLETSLGRAIA